MKLIGLLMCKWENRHKWGKASPGVVFVTGEKAAWSKQCRRCGAVAAVKRREKK